MSPELQLFFLVFGCGVVLALGLLIIWRLMLWLRR